MTNPLDLSIIIVNWNSSCFLKKCLSSVVATADMSRWEVIVVDNGSYDGSAELISCEYPQVKFVQSGVNLGFAKGNNLGVSFSRGRNLLFLNPDTEVVGSALTDILRFVDSNADAGAVGPGLVNPDLSVQFSCHRGFPTILGEMFDAELLRVMFPKARIWGTSLIGDVRGPIETEVVPGTCLMIRRSTFEKVGMFSERYFMYAEDIDLSHEVRRSGLRNYYLAAAKVVHYGGQSSSKAPSGFSTVMIRESVWKFLAAKRGRFYADAYRVTTALSACARIALLTLCRVILRSYREKLNVASGKWFRVLRWSLGLEPWTEDYLAEIQRQPAAESPN